MSTRRTFVAACAAWSTALAGPARAQTSASGRITRLIVAVPPGTSVDTISRAVADQLRGKYADTIIVENKVGASGRIAMGLLKNSPNDGTVLSLVPGSFLTTFPHTYPKLGYDPQKDFTPIMVIGSYSFGLAVGPAVPLNVKTPDEFAAWARQQPRQPVLFSGNGQGTAPHFLGLRFGAQYGMSFDYVPFAGAPDALRSLAGGDLPAVIMTDGYLRASARPANVRVLASFGSARSPVLPDTPTFKELGKPELVLEEQFFMMGPRDMPRPQVDKLLGAWESVVGSAEIQTAFANQSLVPVGRQEPGYAAEVIRNESVKMEGLVKASGFSFPE